MWEIYSIIRHNPSLHVNLSLGLLEQYDIFMHQHFNKWQKNENKNTLHILTHGAMRGCELTFMMICINGKTRDIRESNVTIRSEIWTKNIRSLGFRDIREWVTLQRLILQSSGCIVFYVTMGTFHMTLLMNKWTKFVMDDGWVHPLTKFLPSLVSNLWWNIVMDDWKLDENSLCKWQ